MKEKINQNSDGEIYIDTFPEIPNSVKDVSDGVEFT